MIISVALGLGALFTQYHWLHQALKIIGSAYMLYMAYKIVSSHSDLSQQERAKAIKGWQGFLFQWVNPKVWLIAIGAVSIFSTVHHSYLQDASMIGAAFFVVCVPSVACWMVGGALLQRLLKNNKHRLWFNYTMGALLVFSVIVIFVE